MEEEIIQYSTKYAELSTIEDYTALNLAISIAKGYPSNGTDIYAPEIVDPVNGLYYMEIGSHLQGTWPETLIGITLVDRVPEVIVDPLDGAEPGTSVI